MGKGRDLDYQQRGMTRDEYKASYSGGNQKKTQAVGTKSNIGTSSQKNNSIKFMMPGSVALMKGLIFDPLTKRKRTQKMRGESFLGKPKSLPTTKDYYKLTGEPFDPMSKKGVDFMKEAGMIKPTPIGGTPDNDPVQFCPDGTLPPCKTSTLTKTVKPTTTQNKFLQNFRAYNSGGVSSGPPPKRGPNPQVPPIKMRSGKMTKTYKMSCPHRPDGIRGVGAAIKGHKFIGVK